MDPLWLAAQLDQVVEDPGYAVPLPSRVVNEIQTPSLVRGGGFEELALQRPACRLSAQ